MAEIHIITEQEKDNGWVFTARLGRGAVDSLHTIILSWADCEHWTHGTVAPSLVAEAVVRVGLAAKPGEEPPECFDAARLHREIIGFPEMLSEVLAAL